MSNPHQSPIVNHQESESLRARIAELELENRRLKQVSQDNADAMQQTSRFSRVLEQSLNEIYTFDSQTLLFIEVNRGARENLGYSLVELQSLTPIDLKPELTAEQFAELIEPLRDRSKAKIQFTTIHKRKDGTQYPIEVFLQLTEDKDPLFVAIILDITARKKAEELLSNSEHQLVQAQRIARLGNWQWDISTNEVTWSEGMYRTFGLAINEIKPSLEAIIERVHAEDSEAFSQKLENMRQSCQNQEFDFRILLPDGEMRILHNEIMVMRDSKGNIDRWFGIAQDITERKQAQEALLSNENQLRMITDNVQAFIAYVDSNFLYRFVNKRYAKLVGLRQEEVIGCHVKDILGPQAFDINRVHLENALLGEYTEFEVKLPFKSGESIWIHVSYVPEFAGQETVQGIYVLAHDITARKQVENALLQSEKRFHNIFDNSNDAIFIIDPKRDEICDVNQCAINMLEYTRDELLALHMSEIHPHEKQALLDFSESVIEQGSVRNDALSCKTKSGKQIPCEISASTVMLGDKLLILALVRDNTERKQAEEALKESKHRYQCLFEDSPISLWEEDFTEVKAYLDDLKNKGISNFREYFHEHPEELQICAQKVIVMDVNAATVVLHEAESKEALLGSLDKTFTESSFDVFKEELITLAEGRMHFESDAQVKTLSGQLKDIYLKFSLTQVENNNGLQTRAVVAISDISERKAIEKDLRQSEERLNLALRGTSDGLWDADLATGKEYWSPRYKELLGYKEDEIEATHDQFLTLIHPQDKAHVDEAISLHLQENQPYDCEFRMQSKGGEYRWFRSRGEASRQKNGKPYRIVGSIRDITNRKQAESLQIGQKNLLELISYGNTALSDILEAIILFAEKQCPDIRSTILYVNDNKLYHGSVPNMPESYIELINSLEIGPHAGSCGTAAYCKERVIVTDVATDPLWADYCQLGREYGFAACWSEPMFDTNGKVLGTFALYRAEPGAPNNAEIQLIESMASVASIAIERYRSEEALRESEFKHRSLVESANAVPWKVDLKTGQFSYIGQQVEQLLGYPMSSWVDLDTWSDRIHPEDSQKASAFCLAATSRGENHEFEYRAITADGKYVWIRDVVTVIMGDEEPIELIGFMFDITERKHAEEALRETEETIRALVDTSQDWIWSIDLNGTHTYCNPAVEQILGYTPQEILSMQTFDLIHEDDREFIKKQLAESIANKKGWKEWIIRWRHRDGHYRILESNSVPLIDGNGEFVGYRGTDRDITDRKHAEEQARQLQTDLAHMSRISTMGEMASGLAHELNQPLTIIANYANGCIRRLDSKSLPQDELVEMLERISSQARRSGSIIRGLEGLTRKGTGKRAFVDINESILEVVDLAEVEARRHSATTQLELHSNLPSVLADSTQIQQVILNLIINACEASEQVPVLERVVSVKTALAGKAEIEIIVSDAGSGVPSDLKDKLFMPFFTTKPNGIGMGLAISRSIIEAHKGKIWVTTNSHSGAIFHFTLPIAKEEISNGK